MLPLPMIPLGNRTMHPATMLAMEMQQILVILTENRALSAAVPRFI